MNAAQRIKSIKDELAPVTFSVQVNEVGDAIPVTALGPHMVPETVVAAINHPEAAGEATSMKAACAPASAPVIQIPGAPTPLFTIAGPSTGAPGASPTPSPSVPSGGFTYPLRDDITFPNPFLTVQAAHAAQDILKDMINQFAISPELFEVAQMETQKVVLERIELFGGAKEATGFVTGPVAQKMISKFAQQTLFDVNGDGLLDVRELQKALEGRLKAYARDQANKPSFADDPQKVRDGVEKILVLRPSAIRKALSAAHSAHVQVSSAAPLPLAITSTEPLDPSLRNLYRVFPGDLNTWERPLAEQLDNDPSGIILWWHRNLPQKPFSVALPVPGQLFGFYPDLIVGVKGRKAPGVILIEPKRVYNDPEHNAQDKSLVRHAEYGKVLMLYLDTQTKTWHTIEYDSMNDRNILDRALNGFGLLQSYGVGPNIV